MNLTAAIDPTPIREDADGVIRVGETRVRLASVLYHHKRGATPEEIRERFPAVSLADIYATIAYYLRHHDEVEKYLKESEAEAERVRRSVEARPETKALREKLLARRESAH